MLVGTKLDLAHNEQWLEENNVKPVNPEDGKKAAEDLKLHYFIETSALTQENLKKCFDEAITGVLKNREGPKDKKKKKEGGMCSVL